MKGRALAALSVVVLVAGCEAVPSLSFEDGGPEAGDDATAADAGDAGSGEAGCPAVLPPGAALCCAATPCYGTTCTPNACFNCRCKPGEICCLKGNSLACGPSNTLASCR
jgi:hypothetical protein